MSLRYRKYTKKTSKKPLTLGKQIEEIKKMTEEEKIRFLSEEIGNLHIPQRDLDRIMTFINVAFQHQQHQHDMLQRQQLAVNTQHILNQMHPPPQVPQAPQPRRTRRRRILGDIDNGSRRRR